MSQVATANRVIDAPPTRTRSRRSLLRPLLMLGGIVVVAVGAGAFWLTGGRYVSIDDSYVQAPKLAIATDVSGLVREVDVHDGEAVRKGAVLFRLDPLQFQIAVDGARAALAETGLTMEAMKHDYQRMLHDIDAGQALVQNDQRDFDRYAKLVQSGGVTRVEYDSARFKLLGDQQRVESLRQQAAMQLARLGGNATIDVKDTPQYREAAAHLAEAQRELDHTVVRAPFDGIVTQVDQLQPGQYLPAAGAAFGIVATGDAWIEANPKETEITWVKPGDAVRVGVDTYPDRVWQGVVESLSPNSGSEFSILPAQNSSGNWVKVVQRIPLRVRVQRKPGDPPLRAGMSVEVEIDTGHVRTLKDLY
jgi:membrane fusion protein (multidrug efflux system)